MGEVNAVEESMVRDSVSTLPSKKDQKEKCFVPYCVRIQRLLSKQVSSFINVVLLK